MALSSTLPYTYTAPPDAALLLVSCVPLEMLTSALAVMVAVTHTAPPRPAPNDRSAVSPGSSTEGTSATALPDSVALTSASAGEVNALMASEAYKAPPAGLTPVAVLFRSTHPAVSASEPPPR